MTVKVFVGAFLATVLLTASLEGQKAVLARVRGRVLENGRPIRRLVEVRLESGTTGLIETAYTLGSEEFEFGAVPINLSDRHFLVIDEPGYRPVRQELQLGRDPFGAGVVTSVGIVLIDLVSLPPAERDRRTAESVDLAQLTAEIPDEAVDAYRDALKRIDGGDHAGALEALESAVSRAPDYYAALEALGVEYLRLGRYLDAGEVLGRAYEINDSDAVLLTNLGTLYFQQAQEMEQSARDEAERDAVAATFQRSAGSLADAMRLDPNSARVASYLGSALYKTGALEEAEESLLLAVYLDPAMGDARLTLINVYVRQQRYPAALDQIAAYLAANPDTPERANLEQARIAIESALAQ